MEDVERKNHARHWFANGDPQSKREILFSLGQNLTLMDTVVRVELEKPLEWIKIKI